MKFFYKFTAMALAMMTMFSLAACSDDDDDAPKGGSASLTVDGTEYRMDYNGYLWPTQDRCGIIFSSFDLAKIYEQPESSTMLMITVRSNSSEGIPTGVFSPQDYEVTFEVSRGNDSNDYWDGVTSSCGDLTITKDGSSYTLSIPTLCLNNDGKKVTTSFKYSGGIPKLSIMAQ